MATSRGRHPRLGYALAATASVLFGVNGTVAKVVLASGVSSLRLSEVRCTGSAIGLAAWVLLASPEHARVRPRDLPMLAAFGVGGVVFVQWFYFLAIHRLAVGIALLIQYVAPLFVALWARFVFHEHVRRRIWLALGLALAGLALIVDVRHGGSMSTAGVVFAIAAAFAYVIYLLLAEHGVGRRDTVSLLAWGFAFATLFWAIVSPWWTFPSAVVAQDVSLLGHLGAYHLPVWALMLWVTVPGTLVPFFLLVSALRHLPATRVGITAMLEPVVATVVAWLWLGEALGAVQLAGALIVLAAIALAQTAR